MTFRKKYAIIYTYKEGIFMYIKLKNLAITSYNSNSIDHIKFVKDMKDANRIDNYLYNCIDEMIKKSENRSNLVIGYGYIIKDKDNLVGFVRPARINNIDILNIDYGVHPKYRHQGYGTEILVEVSDFFLDSFDNIHKIKLSIEESNTYSLACAKKAGFIEVKKDYSEQFKTYLKEKTTYENKTNYS